jgi:hypothetical protein
MALISSVRVLVEGRISVLIKEVVPSEQAA